MAQWHSPRSRLAKSRRAAATVAAGAVVTAALIAPAAAQATTDTFSAVGRHTWIVPPGVTQLTVELAAGGGGSDAGGNGCTPGAGAVVQGTIQVAQGAQLIIDVGGRGGDAPVGGSGGAAGDGGDLDGGAGGTAGASGPVGGGGGGGGSGIVSTTAGPLVVAGGGGGCGGFASPAGFGHGGDHGAPGGDGSQNALGGGQGTETGAGAGGISDPSTNPAGSPGNFDDGGAGSGAPALKFGGGGGGGGYRGGGGGGGAEPLHGVAGGGGGGSDLVPAGVTLTPQASTGNGHVTITYTSSWVGTVVGKVFVPSVNPGHIRNGYTLLQTGQAPGSAWIVPSGGVVTAWGFETGSQVPDALELKVGRGQPDGVGAGNFTIVGSSPGGSLAPNQLNAYGVRIPVQAGDFLGAYQGTNANMAKVANDFFPDFATAANANPALGSTQRFDYEDLGVKVPVVALIEPDADADGFGDTSQDACLGRYGTANGCPQADLALTATANATVNVGQSVIYTLTATNNGPDPVPVTITDPVPAGAKFLTAVSNPGSCAAGPPVTCNLGTIASGQSGTATVIVETTQAGTLTNTATVTEPAVPNGVGAGDPNSANDSAAVSTDVVAAPSGGNPGGGGNPGTKPFAGVTIKLKNHTIKVRKGAASISLGSAVAAIGMLKLTTVSHKKTIVLGQVPFAIGAGKTKTVNLRLTTAGMKLLRKNRGTLKGLAVASASDLAGATKTNKARATVKL